MALNENVKNHKETLKDTLYSKDFFNVSDDWKEFPKNRVKVWLIDYTWEYKNNSWEWQKYEWEKVKISNTKLVTEDWQIVLKKKVVWNKSVDDWTVCTMSLEDFTDMINDVKI